SAMLPSARGRRRPAAGCARWSARGGGCPRVRPSPHGGAGMRPGPAPCACRSGALRTPRSPVDAPWSLRALLRLLPEGLDVGPQLLPGGAFGLGQLGQGFGLPHALQVGVPLPVLQSLLQRPARLGVSRGELLGVFLEVVAQPGEGLLAEPALVLGV